MRIPDWTPAGHPQDPALVAAIKARRGGELINLDKALLWSEPIARGWNVYLKAVRTELGVSRQLRELGICTVALLTGAAYEYHHHAPDFRTAGGQQAQLDALEIYCASLNRAHPELPTAACYSSTEALIVQYAAQMTLTVKVDETLFQALQAQFNTTELVELTSAIATYNMVARFLVALGVSPEV
jgi:alkylhydroperoxidase family enzyme